MRETLIDTVVRECGGCDAVGHAWVAGQLAFAVQTRITVKRAVKRGDDGEWTYAETKYASSAAYRQAQEMVERIRWMHPNAGWTLVSYKYWPGVSFVEVFRGAERTKGSDDEDG